jgi:hypothetical protein
LEQHGEIDAATAARVRGASILGDWFPPEPIEAPPRAG